jgi:hypothetical protein
MAKIERGSFTPGGGVPFNTTVFFADPTLLADEIEFSNGPSTIGSDLIAHTSNGLMTPTQQTTKALIYGNNTVGGKTEQLNNKCLLHYNLSGGVITKVLQGSRTSMATAGEFTINIDTLSGTQPIYFVARQY